MKGDSCAEVGEDRELLCNGGNTRSNFTRQRLSPDAFLRWQGESIGRTWTDIRKTALGVPIASLLLTVLALAFAAKSGFRSESQAHLRAPVSVSPVDVVSLEAVSRSSSSGGSCPETAQLSDFSTQQGMEAAGWWFNWTDNFMFKPSIYRGFVPSESYWGFSMRGHAAIALSMTGSGTLTLDFGNLLGTPGSKVSVLLNLKRKASADASTLSKTVDIQFEKEDALSIIEDPRGIIVINSIYFRCNKVPKPADVGAETESGTVENAEEQWKLEYAALQHETHIAKMKDEEHFAALEHKRAISDIAVRDRQKIAQLDQLQHDAAARAKSEVSSQRKDNERLAEALKAMLTSDTEKVRLDALMSQSTLLGGNAKATQLEQAALQEAMKEGALAKEVEAEAEKVGNHGESEQGAILVEQAKEQMLQERLELGQLQNASDLVRRYRRNETWATTQLAIASQQERQIADELSKSEQKEEALEMEEARAAEVVKKAMAKERRHQAGTTTTSVASTAARRSTLYCFALMLPFGYEPELLTEHRERGIGIFACDEHTIFSNSTKLLDSGNPLPVEVELVEISLTVPYGGKWHTALNTGIFNKIWSKVVAMREYTKCDWVVKVDADTVFFSQRLIEVLDHGLPPGLIQHAVTRRRKLQAMQGNSVCNACRLPGHETETCADHALWLQDHSGLSCDEALAQISRKPPLDCGCDCTRLEACEFSQDEAWSKDGGLIIGDGLTAAVEAGDLSEAPIYINNCKFGLHGPIEVLSSAAVTAYVHGLPKCKYLLDQPWGEDKYLDRCMLSLGVSRVNIFSVLSETACKEEPAPCGGSDVAFHPFKTVEDYLACWTFANSYGHGPASAQAKGFLEEDATGTVFATAPQESIFSAVGATLGRSDPGASFRKYATAHDQVG